MRNSPYYGSEEEIEAQIERSMTRLDRRLLGGRITQEQYDVEATSIDAWAGAMVELVGSELFA